MYIEVQMYTPTACGQGTFYLQLGHYVYTGLLFLFGSDGTPYYNGYSVAI